MMHASHTRPEMFIPAGKTGQGAWCRDVTTIGELPAGSWYEDQLRQHFRGQKNLTLRVLDVGCGNGKAGISVVNLLQPDVSELRIDFFDKSDNQEEIEGGIDEGLNSVNFFGLPRKKIQVNVYYAEHLMGLRNGLRNAPYDLILCRHVLQWLHIERLQDALEVIARNLCPNGLLIAEMASVYNNMFLGLGEEKLEEINRITENGTSEEVFSFENKRGQQICLFTATSVETVVNAAGLQVIDVRSHKSVEFPNKYGDEYREILLLSAKLPPLVSRSRREAIEHNQNYFSASSWVVRSRLPIDYSEF